MDKYLLLFLTNYSKDPIKIDRLLVSAFLYSNNFNNVNNRMLNQYIIRNTDIDFQVLQSFIELKNHISLEDLIELFEFVISPSDRIVNGAIYTPSFIRQYIIQQVMMQFEIPDDIKAADISCGCGSFLLTLAEYLKAKTDCTYKVIFSNNLYGADISQFSVERTKLLLSLLAVSAGEDEEDFEFNLVVANSLSFDWKEFSEVIRNNGGFDAVVGNPPYVCSRNMDSETLNLLKRLEVSATGHPDLYIPFFQVGLENINRVGVLSYITVNTFIRSINGRALREYFNNHDVGMKIISFGGEQIFRNRNTYTCICFLEHANPGISFIKTTSDQLASSDNFEYNYFRYEDLNHNDGWHLVNSGNLTEFINAVENTGIPFKEIYNTKNGIATLKNDVYKFKPSFVDEDFFYIEDGKITFPIEKEICREIVNANKIKNSKDLDRIKEQIIFPYDNQIHIIPQSEMITRFPNAYAYLETKKAILAGRDKGKREYETWYAYGRRQSMDISAYKLFFPHICDRPRFVICDDKDLLFYNGMAIVSNDMEELIFIKKLLESDLFFEYIRNCTKDYASGYISLSRNYLKNFGVVQFDQQQLAEFLCSDSPDEILSLAYEQMGLINR